MQNDSPDPRKILLNALKEQVFSKADASDVEKSEMAYNLIVGALSGFLANTKLQHRILTECRALESALGDHLSKFDVVITAKPIPLKSLDTANLEQKAESNE